MERPLTARLPALALSRLRNTAYATLRQCGNLHNVDDLVKSGRRFTEPQDIALRAKIRTPDGVDEIVEKDFLRFHQRWVAIKAAAQRGGGQARQLTAYGAQLTGSRNGLPRPAGAPVHCANPPLVT